jgi:hypothetical protein
MRLISNKLSWTFFFRQCISFYNDSNKKTPFQSKIVAPQKCFLGLNLVNEYNNIYDTRVSEALVVCFLFSKTFTTEGAYDPIKPAQMLSTFHTPYPTYPHMLCCLCKHEPLCCHLGSTAVRPGLIRANIIPGLGYWNDGPSPSEGRWLHSSWLVHIFLLK